MLMYGPVEKIVLLMMLGIPLALVIALILVIRRNQLDRHRYPPPHFSVPSRWERATQLRERRDRYQGERSRILSMVDAGTIAAEEADRLLETLERETTTMDCPMCGAEIRAEAVKCPHCRQFLTDEFRGGQQLRRSHDKLVAGVCGGLAEYADIDPSIVRVFAVLAILFSGVVTGLIVYLIAAVLLPGPDA